MADGADHRKTRDRAGRIVTVIGEAGVGKNTLLAHAHRAVVHRERVMTARVPEPADVTSWLALWTPELDSRDTSIIVSGVDRLPAWAADELAGRFTQVRRTVAPQPFVFTAAGYEAIPDRLAGLIDSVVELPALRLRGQDVLPLAEHFGLQERHRPITFTPAANRALTNYSWPAMPSN